MKARQAASIALTAALLLGTSGCTLFAVQGTRTHYQPSDGVPAEVGSLQLRNILGVSEDGEDVTLLLTAVNTAATDSDLSIQYTDASGAKVTTTVTIAGDESRSFSGDELVLRGVDTTVGGRLDVYLSVPGKQGQKVLVPILDGTLPEYGANTPTPLPEPTPSATPESEGDEADETAETPAS